MCLTFPSQIGIYRCPSVLISRPTCIQIPCSSCGVPRKCLTMSTYTWKPFTATSKFGSNFGDAGAGSCSSQDHLNMTANLVHDEWEILDPTPDVNSMFRRFDDRFFSSKLRCVELEWSKKMYSCAGICYMRKNGMGQSIIIRLSEPLLKLRPRKDLVETLLHEMIHAFCFIRGIREGNGGHGPVFQQMMNDINKVAGTNISVYHTFHDEVNVYKKHVWRCNGICKERKPFFGYVRRVSNRAPGPNDQWWRTHQNDCGGYFQKISEPDKKTKPKKSESAPRKTAAKKTPPVVDKRNQPSIMDLFGDNKTIPRGMPAKTAFPSIPSIKSMPPPSIIPNSRPTAIPAVPKPATTSKRFPGSNIRGFPDLSGDDDGDEDERRPGKTSSATPAVPFTGRGQLMTTESIEKDLHKSIQEQVRNSWAKRYGGVVVDQGAVKRVKTETGGRPQQPQRYENDKVNPQEPGKENQWQMVDTDIAIRTPYVPVVDLLDSDEEVDSEGDTELRDHNDKLTQMANKTVNERKDLIMQELYESEDEGDIEMIDNEFDETMIVPGTGGGGKKDRISDMDKYSAEDVVKCPICEGGVSRGYLSQHMEEGCTGIRNKVAFVMNRKDKDVFGPSSSFTTPGGGSSILPQITKEEVKYPCPNCGAKFEESKINDHLDQCLN